VREAIIKLIKIMGLSSADYFNPFTDANDDYAVLEWMRLDGEPPQAHGKHSQAWHEVMNIIRNSWDYQIGDYARAACKVLGIDKDSLNDTS